MACTLVQWQLSPQAHMRPGDIIEGLKEDHPLPQTFAVFAEAGGLATQWRQSLAQGQVHPFDQGGADREAQVRQAFGAQHDAGAERQQLAVLLLFDQLPIDQIGMWGTDGRAWAAPLPGGCTRHHDVEGGDERRQITRESVAEERGDPRHTGLGCRHDLLGRLSVRGPTTAAIINRNSGAKLTQIHCRPSWPSGKLSPASSVSRACLRAIKFHISSSCT